LTPITVAVDAMGGDFGPSVVVPAALQVLEQYPDLHLILVGDQARLETLLHEHAGEAPARIKVQHASQSVAMDESPATALRQKKDSSMRVAINLVQQGNAAACVSAGNTGALMATARFVLKTLPGIDRPAIISSFPVETGGCVRLLDLGANVDSTPAHLVQFAIMGSVMVSEMDGLEAPRVCLLNIGHEDIKGNELVRESAKLLSVTRGIHYAGYIEGDEIYQGGADVIVCDGFVGNVALKTMEGVALLIKKLLKQEFGRSWMTRLAASVSLPVLKAVARWLDPDRYNGATFIGLKGIVVKSHGRASVKAFVRALTEARFQAEKNIPQCISHRVELLLKQSASDGAQLT